MEFISLRANPASAAKFICSHRKPDKQRLYPSSTDRGAIFQLNGTNGFTSPGERASVGGGPAQPDRATARNAETGQEHFDFRVNWVECK